MNQNPPVIPAPPGVIISHQPSGSGQFIGSPSIAVLQNGAYVASHDLFGPQSNEYERAVTLVFRSEDKGGTWHQISRVEPSFWATLFVHDNMLYLMSVTHHHGLLTLRSSDDGGSTWTNPKDGNSGLLTSEGLYHTGPMPMLAHRGRLWRAIEDASSSTQWGHRYNPILISAPLEANLLKRENWTFSSMGCQSREWLGGLFGGWLEGNVIELPDGNLADVLRVDYAPGGKAAIVTLGEDGHTLEFSPESGFIDLPGGATKFSIRRDPATGEYWTLANAVPACHSSERKNHTTLRNTLALLRSTDLRTWELRYIPLYHPDVHRHGFQYVDWLFEGSDILAVSRTAWEDSDGGAPTEHDANFLTFHRIRNFRELNLEDSPVNPFRH